MQSDIEAHLRASYQQLTAVNRAVRDIALNQSSHEANRDAVPLLKDHDLRQAAARAPERSHPAS